MKSTEFKQITLAVNEFDHHQGVATHYLTNDLGWRHALEKNRQLTDESLLNKALGNFQYLTVT